MRKARQVPAFRVRGLLTTLIGAAAAVAAWRVPELVPAVSFGLFAAATFGVGARKSRACHGACDDASARSALTRAAGCAASPVADPGGKGHRSEPPPTVIVINR
jgi:hypothetical protein